MTALTDLDLKLKGRNWCANLQSTGVITSAGDYNSCLSIFPLSSDSSDYIESPSSSDITIDIDIAKLAYNHSIYSADISHIAADGAPAAFHHIYTDAHKYLTYDANPYGNHRAQTLALEDAPADSHLFEWHIEQIGDGKCKLITAATPGEGLALDAAMHPVITNSPAEWRMTQIDTYYAFESVKHPGKWLAAAAAQGDVYMADDYFKWLMLDLTHSPANSPDPANAKQSRTIAALQNEKATLDSAWRTAIIDLITSKMHAAALDMIKMAQERNYNIMRTIYMETITKHNATVGPNDTENRVAKSVIDASTTRWDTFKSGLDARIGAEANIAATALGAASGALATAASKYKAFGDTMDNMMQKSKKQVTTNSTVLRDQLNTGAILDAKRGTLMQSANKKGHTATIAEINSANSAELVSGHRRSLAGKLAIILVMALLLAWLIYKQV
jgi:hypothetical protein